MAMARRDGVLLGVKKDVAAGGMRVEGSVKMNEKEGGYSLGFKSRTRRTGLHRPRVASYFFRLLFPPSVSFFFSLPSRLSSSPLPSSNPSTAPYHSCFLAPLFILGSLQVSETRVAQKSRLRWVQIQDPRVVILLLGEKKWKRIAESASLANDSLEFIQLAWYNSMNKKTCKNLFLLEYIYWNYCHWCVYNIPVFVGSALEKNVHMCRIKESYAKLLTNIIFFSIS